MKRMFIFLMLSAAGYGVKSQTVTWSTPVTVSSGGTYGNLHPRVALNRAGNPLVLWGKTDTKAYFSRWNGTGFTTPMAVGNTSINVFAQSWAGPDLASYGDTVYVTLKRSPETMAMNHMYLSRSTDGGMTFSDTIRIDNFDTALARFPIVTTTTNGNPLVAFMKFNTAFGDAKYVVSRSTNYGNTFSTDVLASGTTGDVCDCCPGSIISSGSKAIMLFRNNLSNIRDTWASISTDGGATFPSSPLNVDNNNWMIMSCPSSGPDGFVAGDTLYSVFRSSAGGTAKVYLSKTSLTGLTPTTAAIAGTVSGLLSQDYPRIANTGNAAAAVWLQNTSAGKSIVYSFTNNITSGFPAPTTVTGATGSGVMNADVIMTPGAIHIVWEDDNSGNVMYSKGTYTVPSTSISAVTSKQLIELYPNPASGTFIVSLAGIENANNCHLTDNLGRTIALVPTIANGKATFSLQGIAKGNYYFVMSDGAGVTYYSKLIVQ